MKPLIAFLRKEALEHLRTGRLILLGILFVLLGIMNPAVAKLTPLLLDMMRESMATSGMTVTASEPTALDCWMQFFKNIPIGLIAFGLIESGIFTREYRSGTLLLSLTKGLARSTVVLAKAAVPAVLWTAGYWLCAGITRAYAAYYWGGETVPNLVPSLFAWWVFGLWIVGLMILFSVLFLSNTGVLAGTGGAVLTCILLGMFPPIAKYLPTALTDGTALITGAADPSVLTAPLLIAAGTALACFAAGVLIFRRKQL